jgi:hypothetical protein
MASRITQVAVESLQGPGDPRGRLTQLAVEALVGPGVVSARVTQCAFETLVQLGPSAPAANVRQTQEPLEHVDFPLTPVAETQAVLENVEFPGAPLAVETQACLEVLFLPLPPPGGNSGYISAAGLPSQPLQFNATATWYPQLEGLGLPRAVTSSVQQMYALIYSLRDALVKSSKQ